VKGSFSLESTSLIFAAVASRDADSRSDAAALMVSRRHGYCAIRTSARRPRRRAMSNYLICPVSADFSGAKRKAAVDNARKSIPDLCLISKHSVYGAKRHG
jgi:hypothetical protein